MHLAFSCPIEAVEGQIWPHVLGGKWWKQQGFEQDMLAMFNFSFFWNSWIFCSPLCAIKKMKKTTHSVSCWKGREKKKLGLKCGWKGCGYPGGVAGIAKLIYKQRQLCWGRNLAQVLSAAAFFLILLEGHLYCDGEAKGCSCYYWEAPEDQKQISAASTGRVSGDADPGGESVLWRGDAL